MVIPTLKFDPKVVTPTVLEAAREMLLSFPETDDELLHAVKTMIERGGDQPVLFQALLARGLAKKRASEITIEVNRRATSVIRRERCLSLGMVEADWLFSGAPCKGADHKPLNGQRYKLAEGLEREGRLIHPGEEAGCGCVLKPVAAF